MRLDYVRIKCDDQILCWKIGEMELSTRNNDFEIARSVVDDWKIDNFV